MSTKRKMGEEEGQEEGQRGEEEEEEDTGLEEAPEVSSNSLFGSTMRDEEEGDGLEEKGESDGEYTILKAGYRLTIDSWENDLNSFYTFTQEGYTKEDIEFLIKFCQLFRRGERFSNLYEPAASVIKDLGQTLATLIDKYQPQSYHALNEIYDGIEGLVTTALREQTYDDLLEFFSSDLSPHFFGSGDSNFPFFTRVCDRVKVEYIPETIRIRDVSTEFGLTNRR
jgi:hypothetical protein